MLNKCFLSGFLHEISKSNQKKALSPEILKKIILFEIDTYDVLKHWKGSKDYQRLRCIAYSNTMKQIKELLKNKHKGIIIIEGHIGRPDIDSNDIYVIVDKLVLTTVS